MGKKKKASSSSSSSENEKARTPKTPETPKKRPGDENRGKKGGKKAARGGLPIKNPPKIPQPFDRKEESSSSDSDESSNSTFDEDDVTLGAQAKRKLAMMQKAAGIETSLTAAESMRRKAKLKKVKRGFLKSMSLDFGPGSFTKDGKVKKKKDKKGDNSSSDEGSSSSSNESRPESEPGSIITTTTNVKQSEHMPPLELDEVELRVNYYLKHKDEFMKHAKRIFELFDEEQTKELLKDEARDLIKTIFESLQVPPLPDKIIDRCFDRYDEDLSLTMRLEEFQRLYWNLLWFMKTEYFPKKSQVRARREQFIGRTSLNTVDSIFDVFEFRKKLGNGAFGEAHLVTEKANQMNRVCKVINKSRVYDQGAMELIDIEIGVMKSLDHPNVIKIFDVFEDRENIYIVMEIASGGELFDRVIYAHQRGRTLSERYVAELMQQILGGVAYCHNKHVIHKDLKPENILFQDTSPDSPIKLIDFGLAEVFKSDDEFSDIAAGTALYMAPEVFKDRVNSKCDVWSCGCIMYQLISGRLPFNGETIDEVEHKVLKGQPDYNGECPWASEEAINCLMQMLIKNPSHRPSAVEVLQHDWFKWAPREAPKLEVTMSDEVIKNLDQYMKHSRVKNALINLMTHQLNLSGPVITKINTAFRTMDKDGNGILDREEITHGLQAIGIPAHNINRIIQAMDVDQSGNISYNEFLSACYAWHEADMNILWTAFTRLDTDKDGVIDLEEFRSIFGRSSWRHYDVDEIIAAMDKNKDGVVDWEEFKDFVIKGY